MSNPIEITKTLAGKINALVDAPQNILASDVVAAAAKEIADEKREQEIAQAKSNLGNVAYYVNDAVTDLRSYRASAKRAEQKVAKLVRAQEEYVKTGDYSAFDKARREA